MNQIQKTATSTPVQSDYVTCFFCGLLIYSTRTRETPLRSGMEYYFPQHHTTCLHLICNIRNHIHAFVPTSLFKSTLNGLGVQETGQRMPWANTVNFDLKLICFEIVQFGFFLWADRQKEGRIQVVSDSTMPVSCIFSSQHRNEFILNWN